MRGKDRAALRGEAHHLSPSVHIGHQGLIDSVRQSVDDALRARELVKVQLARTAPLDAKQAAGSLAAALQAEIVQVIGRTMTLYRHNPELDRGAGPPWRR